MPGERYLLNVRSSPRARSTAPGLNGYALKAVAAGVAQPALYAYSDMGMFNNGSGTFYLAEVAPHFAGKVLAIDLWDPGDVSIGHRDDLSQDAVARRLPRPVAGRARDLHLHLLARSERR